MHDKQGNELNSRGDGLLDLAPHDTAHAFIGTALEPGIHTMLNSYDHMRYVSANGIDTGIPGTFNGVGASSGLPPVTTHDGRECLDFTSNYVIDLSAHSSNLFVDACTWSFWAWCDNSVQDTQRFVSGRDKSDINDLFMCYVNNGTTPPRLGLELRDATGGTKIRREMDFTLSNQWVHLTFVVATGVYQIYINGVEGTYTVDGIFDPTANMANTIEEGDQYCIGVQFPTWKPFYGYLSDFTIFPRTLTPTEIGYMANETSGFTNNVTNVDIGEVGMFPRVLTNDEKAAFSIQGEKPTTTRKVDVANWQLKMKIEEI